MTRPIFWALAVTAGAAIWGVGLADRLGRPASAPATPAAAPVVRAAYPDSGPNTLVLSADAQGHFSADVSVDGSSLAMLVDTGATHCAIAEEDADRLGIRLGGRDFTGRTQTANGPISVAPVRIRTIRIGNIVVHDVEAVVIPRGRLAKSLLGMSVLRRLTDFSMSGGRLTLRG